MPNGALRSSITKGCFRPAGVLPPHITIKSIIAPGSLFQNENPHLTVGELSLQKEYCHISISDNGIGFDPRYKEQIFEIFQRLYGKDGYPGTGIGLAIVKKIVENHSGIITARSESGKGATFDIYIPAP
jgi:signal transduction histidine kinase